MATYGTQTIGASWINFESQRRGIAITLASTETATKISAYIRSVGSATNGYRATLYQFGSPYNLAYQSSVMGGFTDTVGAWRDLTFTDSVASGTYWLTIFADGIAGGGNTIEIAYDTVTANAALYESFFNDGSTWPTQSASLNGLFVGDNIRNLSMYLTTAAGGTVRRAVGNKLVRSPLVRYGT
jgi:hypothetical protein